MSRSSGSGLVRRLRLIARPLSSRRPAERRSYTAPQVYAFATASVNCHRGRVSGAAAAGRWRAGVTAAQGAVGVLG